MRCYICNYCDLEDPVDNGVSASKVRIDKSGRPICWTCEQETWKYWNYLGKEGTADEGADIYKQVALLEKRIPTLMQGPACPNEFPFNCKCTYKTGCLGLKGLTT